MTEEGATFHHLSGPFGRSDRTPADEVTFQLSDRGHNGEQSLPERAGRIHILLIADELNTQSTKLF
jgi:hypothetical protein